MNTEKKNCSWDTTTSACIDIPCTGTDSATCKAIYNCYYSGDTTKKCTKVPTDCASIVLDTFDAPSCTAFHCDF